VTVPELDIVRARVDAKTDATFLTVGGFEINELEATTTYLDKRLSFSTTMTERSRGLDATGEVIFHPDHQEIHLPQLAIRTQGIEWRNDPGIDNAIQYGNRTLTLKNVRLASGNQSLDVLGSIALGEDPPATSGDGESGDIAALERLLLQDRGLSGQLNAKARITGALRAPTVDGRIDVLKGGFREFRYESLGADLDMPAGDSCSMPAQQSPGVDPPWIDAVVAVSEGSRRPRGFTEQEQIDLRVIDRYRPRHGRGYDDAADRGEGTRRRRPHHRRGCGSSSGGLR
jgi:hypothetical protein